MNEDTSTETGFHNQSPPLILIVDDLPQNLAVLGNILRDEGYQLAIANNGKQAISIAISRTPDLILLDIAMSEMDGLTACSLLKNNNITAGIPVIFLTARIEPEDILNGFKVGAVDYITKPFKAGELLARVSTHIELKKARDLIVKQKNELSQALSTKDKLFSIVSHDLKSPFSGLLLMSNLMVENYETFSKAELLESLVLVRDTADQVHLLMQNLLNWARLQNQTLSFNPASLPLVDEVTKTIEVLKLNSSKKSIDIIVNIPHNTKVIADTDLIRIIIHNLIGNAIKFSYSGGRIYVSAESTDNHIVTKIRDYGVGIPAKKIGEIFVIGISRTTPGTANEMGSGLGLVLCKEMVEKMGGTIGVTSESGKGSTFWFTLPSA
ncbi:MAG: hybrid sensor histidine kinase/response regulator [Bacteroidetes bacterium HGW-Bacteroidetes-11]|jgi:signal transduction histidine kinase|nr:MAG: hybrid sensor histidine kinase/response regulator [Bacteroidetes bacterium HGW-Bacteroidetes-11]